MWKPSFLTVLYTQQNLKGCLAWALLSKSADWVCCYAKYVIFKDISWTEILLVVGEFHSTLLHGRTVSPRLKSKKIEWVYLISIEGRPSLMKIKASFYIKKSILTVTMRRRLQERNFKNLKKTSKKYLWNVIVFRLLFILLKLHF